MNLWLLLTTLTSPDWTTSVFLTDRFISKQTDTAVMLLVKDNTATNVLSSSRVISCLTGSTLVLTKTRSTSSPSQSVNNKETPLSRGICRPVYIAHNSFPYSDYFKTEISEILLDQEKITLKKQSILLPGPPLGPPLRGPWEQGWESSKGKIFCI